MKALQFQQVGQPLQLAELPRPQAAPGALVFRVKACGICTSDLHAAEVPGLLQAGNVLGHEYSGEVVEVGPGVQGWAIGDRLVALPARPCGACAACLAGQHAGCTQIVAQGFDLRMPGAYAEYSSCMAGLAMKIPASLSDADAATIEPLAVGLGAWKAAHVAPGADVLVIGAGIIGLALAQWARFFGAGEVGISEILPVRLGRARDMGVGLVIDAAAHADPVAEFERQTGRKPSVIFECVGRPMLARLIEIAPVGAHLVMVGTGMQPESFTVVSAALKKLHISFPLAYEAQDFPFVQRMLSAGRISARGLVTATVGLDDAAAMFEELGKPNDHCKVLITP